jgi:hypothetical protein
MAQPIDSIITRILADAIADAVSRPEVVAAIRGIKNNEPEPEKTTGLTKAEIAKALGVSTSTIDRLDREGGAEGARGVRAGKIYAAAVMQAARLIPHWRPAPAPRLQAIGRRLDELCRTVLLCYLVAEFIKYVAGEWSVLRGAPVTFLLGILMVGALVFAASRWQHGSRIEHLNERLRLKDDQLADLKTKLAAASSPTQKAPATQARSGSVKPPPPSLIAPTPPTPPIVADPPDVALIKRLAAVFESHTGVQGTKLVEEHFGQVLTLSGTLQELIGARDGGGLLVMRVDGVPSLEPMVHLFFESQWMSKLSIIPLHAPLTVRGVLCKVERFHVTLDSCELL